MVLVILFTIGTSILTMPSGLASVAKQDGWIAAIIGVGVGLLNIWLYIKLFQQFPSMTLVQLNEKLLGNGLVKWDHCSLSYSRYLLLPVFYIRWESFLLHKSSLKHQ